MTSTRTNHRPPWSGQRGWHIADWGLLGWAETAVKTLALLVVATSATDPLVARATVAEGWAVPIEHRLPFWLIAALATGYLITLADRVVDRELVSAVFAVAMVAGYWSLVWRSGLDPWPAGSVRGFACLMIVGDLTKIAFFVTTGARVRNLPPLLPIVMTTALIVVHTVIAFAA